MVQDRPSLPDELGVPSGQRVHCRYYPRRGQQRPCGEAVRPWPDRDLPYWRFNYLCCGEPGHHPVLRTENWSRLWTGTAPAPPGYWREYRHQYGYWPHDVAHQSQLWDRTSPCGTHNLWNYQGSFQRGWHDPLCGVGHCRKIRDAKVSLCSPFSSALQSSRWNRPCYPVQLDKEVYWGHAIRTQRVYSGPWWSAHSRIQRYQTAEWGHRRRNHTPHSWRYWAWADGWKGTGATELPG